MSIELYYSLSQEKAQAFSDVNRDTIILQFSDGVYRVFKKDVAAQRAYTGKFQKFSDWMRSGGKNTSVTA